MIPLKTIGYSIYILALIFGGNIIVNLLGHHFYEVDPAQLQKPFDLVHEVLPDLPAETLLTNIIPWGLALYATTRPGFQSMLLLFASKIFLILLLRTLTTISTILPKYEKCDITLSSIGGLLNGGCYEKVFSSHTAVVYLMIIILLDSNHLSSLASSILLGFQLFFISLTRSHYTVDILVALIITFFVHDGDYGLQLV